MTHLRSVLALSVVGSIAAAWALACSSSTTSPVGASGTASGSSGGGGSGSGGSSGTAASGATSGGQSGGSVDAGAPKLGLLIDNMTTTMGTQTQIALPGQDAGDGSAPSEQPGTWYVYSDYPASTTIGTPQLADVPVAPAITNKDGTQIVGKICLGLGAGGLEAGTVGSYAGLGMSIVYGTWPKDVDAGGCDISLKPPVAFDASQYSGVSFYLLVADIPGANTSIHFGIPDTQTGDKCALPLPACNTGDAGCYDDFGSDVTYTPGQWTKVAFKWSDLGQGNWGAQYSALKQTQLLGMKWQVNGAGGDAGAQPFQFCVSDVYLTP